MGHIFHALDEYAGASGPSEYTNGYFPTINGNHVDSSIANEPNSIMRGGLRWGLDSWARQAIGWRDSDNNGRDDIMDQQPTVSLTQVPSQSGGSSFSGNASVTILPRQGNSLGYGLTLDTISEVEYRLKTGEWANSSPTDGSFDSAKEAFQITIPPAAQGQAVTAQDLDVRVVTSFALKSGVTGASAAPSTTLDNAHAFPNPFKPNSSLGHTEVTFTNLTDGAKVQIFTAAGEPVFDKEIPSGTSTLQWNAVNKDGQTVASGVYTYFISDAAGHKKKGKLAVIR
jgi:hypothetical protein